MKKILFLGFCFLMIVSCSDKEMAYPTDLAGKKSLLVLKKKELKEIQGLIGQLNSEIEKLDPNISKKIKLVSSTMITRKDFSRYVVFQGAVKSDDFVYVNSEIAGRIIQLNVAEGQRVKKGQLIAKLDLEVLKKQIAEVETGLELAKTIYERQSRLWAQNIGSEISYLEAKNNKNRLEKNLETLEFQLSKENVYAAISGVVDKEFLNVGEIASPGAPIVQILNTRKVKVKIDVPENYLGIVRRGDMVTVRFPALQRELNARISLIGNSIDDANRTFKVEIALNNTKGDLKPNLLSEILVTDFSIQDAIVLPLELIQEEVNGREFIFVAAQSDKGMVSKKVYISTGESYQGEILITDGLMGDEELIIDGARNLVANELIQIDNTSKS